MSFKDMFNYKGLNANPVANLERPMDTKSLLQVGKDFAYVNKKSILGVGVAHVIHNYWDINDISKDEMFIMATNELFREIREEYKTVLPYTESFFRSYVLACTYAYIASLQLEQIVSMYNVIDATVPELHEGLIHVIANQVETGYVQEMNLELIDEDQLANTLNKLAILKLELSSMIIPGKVKDLFDWLLMNIFTDSTYPNKQYYVNFIYQLPLFSFTNNSFTQDRWVSVFDMKIDDILANVRNLKQIGAIVNADIAKVGSFVRCLLPSDAIKFKDRDYDYFNILINSYSYNVKNNLADLVMNPEYIRADILGEDSIDHRLAVCVGLQQFAEMPAIFSLNRQAIYGGHHLS